ncbi:GGDEF domain-containing protein [Salisediminibacterium selenitireducens]|uniref:Diguanylate cyclase with GAF sensor n=1 Tax=Bacillus selenitireducens (strain ATCC 700615 / DSM 15326 / MLS10) TaxID=439292 RepID=D6XSP9_BACIE|nr:sensor domain-containing diguanylate cyclase [Salisediminibacterium selenitireducens]ADH98835.1 diguanylate cyclase with GAF sensor [[Bacillus] selenitireducens MLS10]
MTVPSVNRKSHFYMKKMDDIMAQKQMPWSGETRLYITDGQGEVIGESRPFADQINAKRSMMPVDKSGELYLHCDVRDETVTQNEIEAYLFGLVEGATLFADDGESLMDLERKRKSQELLFQANRQFHHSVHVHEVLHVIVEAMLELIPDSDVELYLANDWGVTGISGVALLDLRHDRNDEAATVYVNGKQKQTKDKETGCDAFYAPLPGRQAVYGVMKVSPRFEEAFHPVEIEFIESLTELGGNAIESTDLYEQSRRNIEDLQLINQTAKALNENLNMKEIHQLLRKQMKHAFHADEILFVMNDNTWDNHADDETSEYREKLIKLPVIQRKVQEIRAKRDGQFLAYWDDIEEGAPYKSLMGVPMLHQKDVIGTVLVLSGQRSGFTYDQFRLLQSLVQHSSMAFVNAMLHAEMQKVMVTDYLTGLYTREYMDREIRTSMINDHRGVFLLFDVDAFKDINDVYGHSVGDDVLVQVANILKCRFTDMASISVRWGGEELAVYLKNGLVSEGLELAEDIRVRVEHETKPQVTVSCGVSAWSYGGEMAPKLKDLFNQADEAMYRAKNSGKNKVVVCKT